MVRGNWQKRVERTEARRKEAKEDKQKQKDKRQHKQSVQELVRFLDKVQKNQPLLDRFLEKRKQPNKGIILHLWTDVLAAGTADDEDDNYDTGQLLETVDDSMMRKQRSQSFGNHDIEASPKESANNFRQRSKSISETIAQNGAAGGGWRHIDGEEELRRRSDSVSEVGPRSKKKVHPRSHTKELAEDSEVGDGLSDERLVMSRSCFFRDKVDGSSGASRFGKKLGIRGEIRFANTDANFSKTLCSVLKSNGTCKDSLVALQKSEEAAKLSLSEELATLNPGAMGMVYYSELLLERGAESEDSFSMQLTDLMARKQVKYANIVYVVLVDVLIFDKCRDGLLYENEGDFWSTASKDDNNSSNTIPTWRSRAVSIEKESAIDEEQRLLHQARVRDMTGTIIEHILTFLPDSSVAAASRVCKGWNHEIGKHSSHIWKHLLQRRSWPEPQISLECENESSHDQYRLQFIRHYTAFRDMCAMKSALRAISGKNHIKEREMSYQDFSTRKNSPKFPNPCIGIEVWSQNRVLAAYAQDCSLRLFESEKKPGSREISCRELVCQKIDPYRKTKRRNCRVVSMGLDDESIGCLCHVMADNVDAEAYVLVIMRRDDFLLGVSSGAKDANGNFPDDSSLDVIDIGEAVLNFLLSSEVGDHRLLQVLDFLSSGGEVGEIEVIASHTLASCGYGRFMVEVSISLPTYDGDVDDGSRMVDRKLILFSTRIGAIVWMGECNPLSHELRPRSEHMILSAVSRKLTPGLSKKGCIVAVSSGSSSAIMVSRIAVGGEVDGVSYSEASRMARNEMLVDGWAISTLEHRALVVTTSDIVTSDCLVRVADNTIRERKSVLSFFPYFPSDSVPSYSIVHLPAGVEVIRMACIRDDHVLLLCRTYRCPVEQYTNMIAVFDDEDDEEEEDDFGGIDGNWFVDGNGEGIQVGANNDLVDAQVSIESFLFHIPSRKEVGRMCLIEAASSEPAEVPFLSSDNHETIGIAQSWKGVIMTGADVRSSLSPNDVFVLDDATSPRSIKKKKKGGIPKKNGGKKDGFARGMSLRG